MAQYSLFLSAASVASVILPCGFHAIGSLFAAEYGAQDRPQDLLAFSRYAHRVIAVTVAIAAPVALSFQFIPFDNSEYDIAAIALMSLPTAAAMACIYVNGGMLIGMQWQLSGQLPDTIARPVLLLCGIFALTHIGTSIDPVHLMGVACVVFWIAALIQWYFLRQALTGLEASDLPPADSAERRKWWALTPSWMAITLLWDYFFEIHMLIAGFMVSPAEVALLYVCFRLRQLAGFGMSALYSLILPKIFVANANESTEEVRRLVRLATRTTLVYAVAAWLGAAVLGSFVLSFFGDEFQDGKMILLLIMGTIVARAVFGPAPAILGMKRFPGIVAAILAASLILSLSLIALGFNSGGVATIAGAYLTATVFTSFAMWIAAKRKTGINCAVWA